ncbi:hypothetical protein [Streptomyces sp. NPDC050263]|uniref:hypothetical protein n=1 Tax=Streptomyces sp. NPDC050263 TaxID=3155037 RepID=UPI003426EF1F
MREITDVLLGGVMALESGAFRAGQVARRLLSEHPELTVRRATCSAYSHADTWDPPTCTPTLDLRADGLDGVRAWALVLGAEVKPDMRGGPYVYESGDCEAEVDGVLVRVTGSRKLTDDEAAAWRNQQTEAAAGGEG